MKKNDPEYSTIFDKQFLERLPVFYRYMTITLTETIGEMYSDARFSTSVRHFSREYMQSGPVSAYSNLFIPENETE
jgi:hypothetical protein